MDKVNCIYYDGKLYLLFVNDNVNVIYFGLVDLDLGLWRGLWISVERVGICWGGGLWKDD